MQIPNKWAELLLLTLRSVCVSNAMEAWVSCIHANIVRQTVRRYEANISQHLEWMVNFCFFWNCKESRTIYLYYARCYRMLSHRMASFSFAYSRTGARLNGIRLFFAMTSKEYAHSSFIYICAKLRNRKFIIFFSLAVEQKTKNDVLMHFSFTRRKRTPYAVPAHRACRYDARFMCRKKKKWK